MGYLDYMNKKNEQVLGNDDPSLGSGFTSYKPSVSTGADNLQNYDSKPGGVDLAQTAVAGGTGAAMGGPAGAAVAIGGSLASQYLAQKAQDERAKREREQAIIKGHADDEQQIISQIMQNNARALS